MITKITIEGTDQVILKHMLIQIIRQISNNTEGCSVRPDIQDGKITIAVTGGKYTGLPKLGYHNHNEED
jgi:hypothetical protein